jgi:hypothetical protein
VPYAFVLDVPASWEHYEPIAAALADPAPAGLILHVAGPTDEGFRTIEVWETREAWERFRADRLAPALAARPGPAPAPATLRELHALSAVPAGALRIAPWRTTP